MLSNYSDGLSDHTPDAPWNEPRIPERDFDVLISQTLSKDTTITTQDYQPEFDEEGGHTYANTDDTDWKKAYYDSAMTPLDIINAAGKIAKALISEGKTKYEGIFLKTLVDECEDWVVDETEVMEN